MKEKIILSISLMLLVGLAVFVSASMIVTNERDNIKVYSVEIPVTKGWNLIASGFIFVSDLSYLDESGDIKRDNIKGVYVYSNKINQYLSNYPEYDERLYSAREYFNGDEQDIIGSANWIYVDKSGTLKYQTKAIKMIDSTKLFAGWNFVSITPEYIGKDLNGIKGDCNIGKAYFWNPEDKKWDSMLEGRLKENKFNYDIIGLGIIIKVSDNCNLGSGGSSISPPAIPNISDLK